MKAFFDQVRKDFGPLRQAQVDGFEAILAATTHLPLHHRAYVMATAWHETAKTMQPIREYGRGQGKPYGVKDSTGKAPYGRGYVQLTWRDNYLKADRELSLGGKLSTNYDLALDAGIAAKILVRGMSEGWFTGKKMSDYTTYEGMRRVVNGTDRASLIAGHARKFEGALGKLKTLPIDLPDDPPAVKKPSKAPAALVGSGIISVIIYATWDKLAAWWHALF